MTETSPDNQLLVLYPNGRRDAVAEVAGLTIDFRGRGALVEIEAGAIFQNCRAALGHGGRLRIGKTHARGLINTIFDIAGVGRNCHISIGRGTSIEGCRFAMGGESNLRLRIGRDCMLSSGITFRATDGHTIFDLETGEVRNHARPTVIGNHVWIGAGTTVLKGTQVADNTIIGTCAVVTGQFSEENTAIAGNPARVVRSKVGWDRRHIPTFLRARAQAERAAAAAASLNDAAEDRLGDG